MAKVAVALRLSAEVIQRVDALAEGLSASRQRVLESFVLDGLDSAKRAPVELPPEPRPPSKSERERARAAAAEIKAREAMEAASMARQVKLNAAKYR